MAIARLAVLALLLAIAPGVASRAAEPYPTRPVRLIVPFTPGGGVDLVTRVVAEVLAQALGQPFVVENRPGAGANLGADLLAKAAPDGYTLGTMTIGTHGINPTLYRRLPFDPVRDFTPIAQLVTLPNLVVVPPSIGVRSIAELVALARARPGALNFASSGNGTSLHLSGEIFKRATGVDIVHVPYRGAGVAMPDLLAGQVQLMFGNLPSVLPHVRTGALVALAVTSRERWPQLPDVPTLAETGLPDADISSWYALMGPAGMPPERVGLLNRALNRGLNDPTLRDRLIEMGAMPAVGTPEALAAHVESEIRRWRPIVQATGLTID